jgi:arylsulfatase A-like enzyme
MVTQTRRDFLKTSAAFAATGSLSNPAQARKPNLLFLWTDEQRADSMRVYGNHRIHAPNLNKLADESFVFERAYVTQPVCTPSRSSILTGLWPHSSGCLNNNIPLPVSTPCFPELLKDTDYRTAYMGKWHLGDEIFAQHGFEEWVSIEEYRRYYREDRPKDQRSSYCGFLKDLGYQPDSEDGTFTRGFASRLPIDHCKPKFLEMKACDFLRRHRQDPFVLHVNFLEPHMPFHGPLNEEHRIDEIVLPANYNNPCGEKDPLRYRLLVEYYRRKGSGDQDLSTEDGWRQVMRNYWGLITQVDRSVGEILKTLEDLGLSENTIVVFTSDHGDMMGSHRLLAKTVMYEESTRIPWLMRVPWMGKSQRVIPQPASQIDMIPTLLGLFGRDSRDYQLPGQSLLPHLEGGSVKGGPVFIEWNPSQEKADIPASIPGFSDEEVSRAFNASIRTVVSPDGWKLCLSDLDKNQLFNLREDPLETENLYGSEAHKDVTLDLRKRIALWQERTGDTAKI